MKFIQILRIVAFALAAIFAAFIGGIRLTHSQRKKYPFLQKLDGKNLHFVILFIFFMIVGALGEIWILYSPDNPKIISPVQTGTATIQSSPNKVESEKTESNNAGFAWEIKNKPKIIEYYINSNGLESEVQLAAIIRAFDTWEEITKNIIKFDYKGLVKIENNYSDSGYNFKQDGKNVVSIVKENWQNLFPYRKKRKENSTPLIALSRKYYIVNAATGNVYITESDIFINSENYKLNTSYTLYGITFDIENLIAHEVGHLLGLRDFRDKKMKNTTMYPSLYPLEKKKRTLEKEDIYLFLELYNEYVDESRFP